MHADSATFTRPPIGQRLSDRRSDRTDAPGRDERDRQRRPVPLSYLRVVHHAAPRTQARPHPGTHEWLFREEIDDGLELVDQITAYRQDYNHVRPHEAIAWNRPAEVYTGLADPTIPNFEIEEILPTT